MIRLLQLVPSLLIAVVAIEGSVVHLAHSDHCRHRHGELAHRHGVDEFKGGELSSPRDNEPPAYEAFVAGEAATDATCFACSYLSQRAGERRAAVAVEFRLVAEPFRSQSLPRYEALYSGLSRARAPPWIG